MKKLPVLFFFTILFLASGFDRNKPAYILYNEKGREVNYRNMMRELSQADIILFGELHDNPISHWLQLEITRDLFEHTEREIILAAEMFEADNQLILDEYVGGLISDARFEDEARLWSNYKTDYKPLVLFARNNSMTFIASNIPRRYANMVFHGGFESLETLTPEALSYIAPLPVPYDPDLPGYKAMREMGGGGMPHSGENLPKAQAIKDATMAHFITEHRAPGSLLIHFHGTYHSDNFEGIYWYLKQHDPEIKIVTISSVTSETPGRFKDEYLGRANFILVTPETMTRTY
jgi:uncharacterized iron-regulated protein